MLSSIPTLGKDDMKSSKGNRKKHEFINLFPAVSSPDFRSSGSEILLFRTPRLTLRVDKTERMPSM